MERIYCGTGKEKFDGNLVEVALCVSDLPKDKIYEFNGKKYIKLKVVKKKEVDQYGKSHYVEVDMFEPKKETVIKVDRPGGWEPDNISAEIPETDLPF